MYIHLLILSLCVPQVKHNSVFSFIGLFFANDYINILLIIVEFL